MSAFGALELRRNASEILKEVEIVRSHAPRGPHCWATIGQCGNGWFAQGSGCDDGCRCVVVIVNRESCEPSLLGGFDRKVNLHVLAPIENEADDRERE